MVFAESFVLVDGGRSLVVSRAVYAMITTPPTAFVSGKPGPVRGDDDVTPSHSRTWHVRSTSDQFDSCNRVEPSSAKPGAERKRSPGSVWRVVMRVTESGAAL